MRGQLRAIALLGALGHAGAASAELTAVWALDDGTKIPAGTPGHIPGDTGVHPLAHGNGIFASDPAHISLFGLRNEIVAFQVILQGGAGDTGGVTVALDAVGPIDNRSASDDPDRYFVDRYIEIFEQRYLSITERSHSLPWLPGSDAEPAGPMGWVPDALVPHRQAMVVPAHQRRGLWIDIYIPRDAPAGIHRGTLTVRVNGQVCGLPACTLPIALEVLPVTLPDAPPVATMLWASAVGVDEPERVMPRYFADHTTAPAGALDAVRRRHHHLARRYRVTLIETEHDGPTENLRQRLTGEAFTRAAGYTGPGEGLGQDVCGIHVYGGRLWPEEARRWHTWLSEHAPGIDAFLYVVDEPSDPARIPEYNDVAADAEPIDAFVTTHTPLRFPAFDIFAVPPSYHGRVAGPALAEGKQLWVYNGIRPYSGSFAIDDVAISPRVNPWIQHAHGVPRWFYWEATYYEDFQGGRSHIDVLHQSPSFSNRHGDRVHGDGLLMYPGRDHLFPASDLGIDRPLPSIRLANWRRGIQDVGYLALVRAAGHGPMVDRLVQTLIPRSIDTDLHPGEPVSWPEDGERWLAARRYLFETLRGGQPSAIDWATLARPSESWWPHARRQAQRWLAPFLGSPRRRAATALLVVVALGGITLLALRRRRRRRRGS
jgi:Domain of unknown function (DUF4091)